MKKLFFLFMAVTFFVACGGEDTAKQLEAKYKEIDDAHNEAMDVGMSAFQSYEKKLEGILKEADTDTTVLKGQSKEAVNAVLEQVEGAYKGMMTWMKEHQNLEELEAAGKSFEEKMAHMTTDLQAINKVNDDTNNTIKVAEELMNKLGLSEEGHEDHDHSHGDHSDHDH
jgi:hypothetical protein